MSGAWIYLDHNATTGLEPEVAAAMSAAALEYPANPASQHQAGRSARRRLETARVDTLRLLGGKTSGMDADRLILTSGGTEANNLALLGLSASKPGGPVFVSAIEHPSVLMTTEPLRQAGHEVRKIPVGTNGQVDLQWLAEHLSPEAALVSVMLANNETGVIQPVSEIAKACRDQNVPMHCDAVQAAGKIEVPFRELDLAAMTIAAHKFNGPLGIGGLVLRHGTPLAPRLFGGFQQASSRPGTESVALAVGLNIAIQRWIEQRAVRSAQLQSWRDSFESAIVDQLADVVVVGQESPRLGHVSCLAFLGVDRQALFLALDAAGICCSTGSACASGSSEPSSTLVAMGLSKGVVESALRFSFGITNSPLDGKDSAERIIKCVKNLRLRKNPSS
jgi:cysteine desulfurase